MKKMKKIGVEPGRVVLAHGEVTGHAHAIYDTKSASLFEYSADVKVLKVKSKVELLHEEHKPIIITPGTRSVSIKRQYDAKEGWAKVLD